jgi:prolipoprotein diacylglyceryltransferase
MEFPVRIEVAGVAVPAHVLLEFLGYAAGFQAYRALRRRAGDVIGEAPRWAVVAAAAVGAALGSKLLFLLDDPAASWARRHDPAALLAGKTIVGGLLGGWVAVEAVKRMLDVERRTGDLSAPLCLGIAVGRVGCFLEGLGDATFGVATALPWGVDFGDGVARHPTQLYEAAFLLALAVPFLRATARPHADGSLFRAFVAAYCAWRLAIDFLKPGGALLGMSGIQWVCAATLGFLAAERLLAARPPADAAAPAEPAPRPEVASG